MTHLWATENTCLCFTSCGDSPCFYSNPLFFWLLTNLASHLTFPDMSHILISMFSLVSERTVLVLFVALLKSASPKKTSSSQEIGNFLFKYLSLSHHLPFTEFFFDMHWQSHFFATSFISGPSCLPREYLFSALRTWSKPPDRKSHILCPITLLQMLCFRESANDTAKLKLMFVWNQCNC